MVLAQSVPDITFMRETGSDAYKLARFEHKASKYGTSGLKLQFKSLEPSVQTLDKIHPPR